MAGLVRSRPSAQRQKRIARGRRPADTGPLRVIVRADQRARQLRCRSQRGEQCEMRPVAADGELGVTFFAILLPWDTELASIKALDADGQVLEDGRIRPLRPRAISGDCARIADDSAFRFRVRTAHVEAP